MYQEPKAVRPEILLPAAEPIIKTRTITYHLTQPVVPTPQSTAGHMPHTFTNDWTWGAPGAKEKQTRN